MNEKFRPGTVIANEQRKCAGVVNFIDTDGYYIRNIFGWVHIPHNEAHLWHDAGTRSLELFDYVWKTSKRFPFYICNDQKSIYYRDRENGFWRFMEIPTHKEKTQPVQLTECEKEYIQNDMAVLKEVLPLEV